MLFAIEKEISKRNSSPLQTSNHEFRLVGRNNPVLCALKEDYRHRQAINVINRRTIDVSLMFLRVGSLDAYWLGMCAAPRAHPSRATTN